MDGINLMLCIRGNEAHYCSPDAADWWVSQGWTVFALQPQRIAGEEDLPEWEPRESTWVKPADVVEQPTLETITRSTEVANG